MTLSFGSSGPDVSAWQNRLTSLGFPVVADGYFGVDTYTKTQGFQRAMGLPADGIVGAATLAAAEGRTLPNQDVQGLGLPWGLMAVAVVGVYLVWKTRKG